MVKLDGKITGNQIKKCFNEILEKAKNDGYILGKSVYVSFETLEIISNEIDIEFEPNFSEDGVWQEEKENPVWAVDINFIQTGKIYQVLCKYYDWDLKKVFDRIAKLIKKELNNKE